WLEQALDSVRGHETVLVDHGSSDGTVRFVRDRYADVEVIEEENRGLAFGWNTGVERTSGRYVLLLNSDAWLDDGALDALVASAARRSSRWAQPTTPSSSSARRPTGRTASGRRVGRCSSSPAQEPRMSTPRRTRVACSSRTSAGSCGSSTSIAGPPTPSEHVG